jgi:O-antigen/teichoic acid export membrane protein
MTIADSQAPPTGNSPDAERHFDTDDVRRDLHTSSVRSGLIQMSAQALQLLAFLASAMILARLLTPFDFGLFALANTLIVIVGTIRDFGLPMAAVHHEDLNHDKLNALFWLSATLSFVLFAFLILTAPLLAWFYGENRLTAIASVLAVGTLALGITTQHESLLIRRMRFRVLRTLDLAALLAGLCGGVGLAILGAGYWALVCQIVGTEVLRALGTWFACNWRPSSPPWRGGGADIRELTRYAGYLGGYQALVKCARSLDRVLVGYMSGAAAAGLYYNAHRWAMYPIVQVFPPLMSVAVSGLSRLQNDAPAFRLAWRKGTLPVLSIVIPALTFCAVESRATVLVVMGRQWEGSVPIFRLLCVAALAISVERLSKWLYLAQGATRQQFVWGLIYTPVMILAVVIGVQWGPVGAAVGFTIGSWLLLVPGVAFCLARSHVRWQDVRAVVWRPGTAAAFSALGTALFSRTHANAALFEHFVSSVAVFGSLYLLAWVALPGGRSQAADVLRLLSSARAPALRSQETHR